MNCFIGKPSRRMPRRLPRRLRGFNHAQAAPAARLRGRFDHDLYVPSKGVEPTRKPVYSDALHAATEHFGKRRLIRTEEPRRFCLRQSAPPDGVLDGDYQATFGGEFRRLGWRKSNIGKHVATASLKGKFAHVQNSHLPLARGVAYRADEGLFGGPVIVDVEARLLFWLQTYFTSRETARGSLPIQSGGRL